MDLSAVMDQLADRLRTITGINVFASPPGTLIPPGVVVEYPDTYDFDMTYGRGTDRMTIEVTVAVGKPFDPSTRGRLAAFCNGSGSSSVKAVLESGTYTAFDQVRVIGIEFTGYTVGDVAYMAAIFSLDIVGNGA